MATDWVGFSTQGMVYIIIAIAILFFVIIILRLFRLVHKEGKDIKKQMDSGKLEDKKQKDRDILFSESRHENVMDADYEVKK